MALEFEWLTTFGELQLCLPPAPAYAASPLASALRP
jgi:hypothetical protein